MQIYENVEYFPLEKRSAVAIGKFDGIHIGHRELIRKINAQKEQGLLSVVFTFEPAPAVYLGFADEHVLSTKAEKRRAFEEMGVDVLIEFPMNDRTAKTKPYDFIEEYLVRQMKAAYIVAGTDLSFGDKGAGNCKLLAQYADSFDYKVDIIDKIKVNDIEISSTYIRDRIEKGDIDGIEAFLGDYYSIEGVVAYGKQLGRKLGMPTLNVIPEKEKLLPAYGVYYSLVEASGKTYKAITNIGCKPTVTEEPIPLAETFLYGFEGDMYGEAVTVKLLKYTRPEKKFSGIDELKEQMQKDIDGGRQYHNQDK